MKSIIGLLIAGSLASCTNNVSVVSCEEIDSNVPEKVTHVSTKYGLFQLKEYKKGSEIQPIGSFVNLEKIRDLDGDKIPDEMEKQDKWITIKSQDKKRFEDIYASVYSKAN